MTLHDTYIIDGIRTPIGRYGGALAGVRADDLGAIPLKALLARHPQLDPALIDEVYLGCANQAGEDNRNVARMSLLLAGLPVSVPGSTVNRLCGSGLDAIGTVARGIAAGELGLAIAGGVESMSRAPYVNYWLNRPWTLKPSPSARALVRRGICGVSGANMKRGRRQLGVSVVVNA